ncbi:MAG TPA: hypothetical protein VNI58_03940 [Mariprofundaceae bacterium]|nr:hypothetical protein [Mariprofundaceae bacterium]
MNAVEQRIHQYLDAVEKAQGAAVRRQTIVEDRGGSHVFLKRPDDEFGQLISIGHLEIMTDNMSVH